MYPSIENRLKILYKAWMEIFFPANNSKRQFSKSFSHEKNLRKLIFLTKQLARGRTFKHTFVRRIKMQGMQEHGVIERSII